ncbi:MAG: GNAT family N-acetyltransferase [Solimonas sp.]
MSAAGLTLRPAAVDDAAAIARLSGMFGYEADADAHAGRLTLLLGRPEHAVWIADIDGEIRGWLHAMQRLSLESASYVEIAGLVVDEAARSQGIGARLVQAAEAWAVALGLREMRVRSNIIRERAHAFYERAGYRAIKDQRVFAKALHVA